MAEAATYIGVDPRTIKAAGSALARGVRVTRNSSGVCAVAGATTRGDYVTLTAIDADTHGAAVSMHDGAKVPALASEAATVGAAAYAAADGKFSVTATSAAVVGRWTMAASGDGVLGEVELLSVL